MRRMFHLFDTLINFLYLLQKRIIGIKWNSRTYWTNSNLAENQAFHRLNIKNGWLYLENEIDKSDDFLLLFKGLVKTYLFLYWVYRVFMHWDAFLIFLDFSVWNKNRIYDFLGVMLGKIVRLFLTELIIRLGKQLNPKRRLLQNIMRNPNLQV